MGDETRTALAQASLTVAKDAAKKKAPALRRMSQDIRPWQQIAASVHGWDKPDPQAGRGGVNIAITITRDDMKVAQVVDVESDVRQLPPN
jgi:hypothetical protein